VRVSFGPLDIDVAMLGGGTLTATEVVLTLLIVLLAKMDADFDLVTTVWTLYTLLRFDKTPRRHLKLFAGIIKDLPCQIQMDLVREVFRLSDAGSVLLTELLVARIPLEYLEKIRTERRPGHVPLRWHRLDPPGR
jgi:hypothetical protein